MKKRIAFIAVLGLVLCFFSGCGENEIKDNPPVDNPPTDVHTHFWGSWIEEKAATCTEPGEKTRKCNSCDQIETEEIPALNHNFKDGYCTRCSEIDPTNTEMVDGREFVSVTISNSGVLSFSRLKCASKYVITISNASEENRTIELDKTQGSYSLESLPSGRTMVTLTAYEKLEIKVENETHYQDVPISTATDEFRITKVNNTYSLDRLKYTDAYITLEGFYDEPRIDSQTDEAYYLYETIYKAPSLSNIMNNSHIKDAKNFKLKDSSKYKLVYYESNGTTSFTLGANHYMNVERASYTKYYIAVVEKDTDIEVKRYPIKTYGLTTAEIEFKQLIITEENGIRQVETKNLLDSVISMTEGDILTNQQIYPLTIESGLLARTSLYSVIERDEDLVVPASNTSGKVILYFYEEELVREDCQEYENVSKEFNLTETEYGWTLRAVTQEKNVIIPAYIVGKPVVSASFYNSPLETLTLSEGITMWIVSLNDCANIKKIILPSTITYMPYQSFNGVRSGCEIYCNFSKSKGDSFVTNWNQIVGSFYTYNTYYIDTPITKDGCQVQILDGKGVITGYTGDFTGTMPSSISFGSVEYKITKIADNVFSNCEISSVVLPNALEEIGESAFTNCLNLTSITLPETLESINDMAFYKCFKLVEVCNLSSLNIEIGSSNYGYVGYYAKVIHTDTGASSLIEQDGFTFYKDSEGKYFLIAYSGPDYNIVFPKDIMGYTYEINEEAFKDYNDLESVTISDGITKIGKDAFLNCYNLSTIYYEGNIEDWCNSIFNGSMFFSTSKYLYVFENDEWKNVSTVEIPNTISKIENDKFYGFYMVSSITLPLDCQIESNAFYGCYITNLYYNGTIEDWCNSSFTGNQFFNSSTSSNHFYVKNEDEWEEVINLEIPTTITILKEDVFSNFTSITSLVIHDSIEKIGTNAFLNCINITTASTPASAIKYIPKDKIKEFIVTSGDEVTGFSSCKTIQKVTISEGVTSIGNYAFKDATALETLILPESMEYISPTAFQMSYTYDNRMFNEYQNGLYLGSEDHPYRWLIKAKSLYITSCNIHEETKYIYYRAFRECSINSLSIGSNVIRIEDEAFYWCSYLTSIVIPDSVTSIGSYAFWNNNGLISLVMSNQVRSIGENAFFFCINLKKVYYKGTTDEWNNISIEKNNSHLEQSTIYFYSEDKPVLNGNYWHYVDGVLKEWE